MLNLLFLGPFQVSLTNQPLSFQTNKVRALLAYLAVEGDQAHERATLVGLLWPEVPAAQALNNLSKGLGLLRQALQEPEGNTPYLLTNRQSVHWNANSPFWLDVAAFQQGTAAHASIAQLERALALYRGEFLSGFSLPDAPAYETWLLLWRERLHQQALSGLERLAGHYLEAGDYAAAQRYARRQLELDNWREIGHTQLMQALALAGDRTAALAQYENCRRLLAEGLGVEPAAETVALYESIKAGSLTAKKQPAGQLDRPVAHNLPSRQTKLIGRQQELAALDALIYQEQARLVTIVGPGGVGKTRLALAYAERCLARPVLPFPDGVYFTPLAHLSLPSNSAAADQIVSAISAAVKLPPEAGSGPGTRSARQQLLDYLKEKRLVLILDNFEVLLAPAGAEKRGGEAFLAEILQVAPGVQLIVTSQERLRLYGERVYPLPGLGLPDLEATETAAEAEAVQLFVQTARRVQPDFQLGPADWRPIAQLCHTLGGLPLAIELAASWSDTLSVPAILTEIQRNLDFLNSELLDVAYRHQSMGRVLDCTWQRLAPEERATLAALSVFQGAFTRQVAQAVAKTGGGQAVSLSLLRELVHKALLHYDRAQDRYSLHELLRHYGRRQLAAEPAEEAAVRQRHSAYYCTAVQARENALKGRQQQVALAEMEADIENIRAAWHWAVTQGEVSQVAATLEGLFHFYDIRSWFQEGKKVLEEAARDLAALPASRQQAVTVARLQARAGWFTFHLGGLEESVQQLTDSLARLQQQAAEVESIFNLNYLGAVLRHQGAYEQAEGYLSAALRLAQAYDDSFQASISLNILGQIASLQGDYALARHYCQESLRLKRALGDYRGITYSLTYLGRVARALGEHEEAERLFRESQVISDKLGDQRGVAFAWENLAGVAEAQGQLEQAADFYHRGLALYRNIGNPLGTSVCLTSLAKLLTGRGELDGARKHLREGLAIALATGARLALLTGLLALAEFWFAAGQPARGTVCLACVQQQAENDRALQERAQQLEKKYAGIAGTAVSGGFPQPAGSDLASFVQGWLPFLT